MVEIIHLIPNKLVYGAGSMLDELHFAIDKHHGNEVSQSIISLSSKSPGQGDDVVSTDQILNHIQSNYTNPVVFMHKISKTNCSGASAALFSKVPFNIINHTQAKNPVGLADCDHLVCVSNHMLHTMKQKTRSKGLVMIRNGVNACRYENIKPLRDEAREGYFVSGRLNNFNATKHPRTWLRWLNETPISGVNHWHDYLGAGQRYSLSRNYALKANKKYRKQKNKVHLNLPGRIDDFEKKIAYIKSWDVFLYEIVGDEGTSMSMLEALACGKPAIINNRRGNTECIKKWHNGFICKDRKIMYNRLKKLAQDPELLASLQANTKEYFMEHLDAKYMARDYVQLAQSMV